MERMVKERRRENERLFFLVLVPGIWIEETGGKRERPRRKSSLPFHRSSLVYGRLELIVRTGPEKERKEKTIEPM